MACTPPDADAGLAFPSAPPSSDASESGGVLREEDVLAFAPPQASTDDLLARPEASSACAGAADAGTSSHDADSGGGATILELLRFTLPTMAIWLASPVLSLVDASVVGSRSVTELAALTPGTVMVDYVAYIFSFLGIATTNILSVTIAEGNHSLTRLRLNDALALALACGVALGACIFFGSGHIFPMLINAQSAGDLVGPAGIYAGIRALGIPFAFIGMVFQCAFLAAKNTRVPLIATVVAGLVNLVGDLALVPSTGIAGAAWATVASQIVAVLLLYKAAAADLAGTPFKLEARLPELSSLLKFVRIAGPVSLILLSKVVVFCTVSFCATNLGAVGSAAHALMFSVFLFFCVPGDALNQCAQTFLPPVRGRPAEEVSLKRRLLWTGALVGLGNAALGGGILLGLPDLLTTSDVVVSSIRQVAPVVMAVLLLHPFGISTEGVLMATQHFTYLLATYAFNMVFMLGLVKAAVVSGPTLSKVWLCMLSMQMLRLLANLARVGGQLVPRKIGGAFAKAA